MSRKKKIARNRERLKHIEGFKEVASDVMNKGYFVKTHRNNKDYWVHPKGNGYYFLPKLEGAAVFDHETAQILAEEQNYECEILTVAQATKE